jgi:hypothetical protein
MAWWLLSVTSSAWAGDAPVCGAVVTQDLVLGADLVCPEGFEGAALTVAAPGVTVDGAGHKVQIAGGAAVRVQAERVTVRGLRIEGAGRGVEGLGSDGLQLQGLSLDGFDGTGVWLESCDGCSVSGSSFVGARSGVMARGRHSHLLLAGNDLSQVRRWAVTLEDGLEDVLMGNTFEGARGGVRLRHARSVHISPDNVFSGGLQAVQAEQSEQLTLEGLWIDGFAGTALTLWDCDGCEVKDSSLLGAGQALAVLGSDDVRLTGNDLRHSRQGVAVTDSHGLSMDGGNTLDGISGISVQIVGGSAELDGLVTTGGAIEAVDTHLQLTDHRSCGGELWLDGVTGSLQGALGALTQHGGSLAVDGSSFPDADADALHDACDPCIDPDLDGVCSASDPCLGKTAQDSDGDGWCQDTDCDDTLASVHPQAQESPCNGLDDDCSESTSDTPDADRDGFAVCTDCDDQDPSRFPGAKERCNGRDDDCNAQVDDGLPFDAWFADADHDGYGGEMPAFTCDGAPPGHVSNHVDCDDSQPFVHPGAPEILHNGVDDDCNRLTPDTERGTVDLD